MPKYVALPATAVRSHDAQLQILNLPELVLPEDAAQAVMIDFTKTPPQTIHADDTMDKAILELEVTDSHFLLVTDQKGYLEGIVSAQDVFGEKPILISQQRRLRRDQILVRMVMTGLEEIIELDEVVLKHARVGHIAKTLSEHHKRYALVVKPEGDHHKILGVFTQTQLSKQLHTEI